MATGVVHISIVQKLPTEAIQRRLADPLEGDSGRLVVRAMRKGDGSVDDQFRRQGAMTLSGGFQAWPKTKPFGKDAKFQARTLKRTGRYLADWRGEGAGGYHVIERTRAAIGVDPSVHPQVFILMGNRPHARRVTDKMRGYLAAKKGVYLKKTTQFLITEPRPFRVNPQMLRRARHTIANYVLTGQAVPA